MPKTIDKTELNQLKSLIETMKNGVSISELIEHVSITVSRRTLQRRLEMLISSDKISYIGEGRGRRYYRKEIAPLPMKSMLGDDSMFFSGNMLSEEPTSYSAGSAEQIPLSAEALELKAQIQRPLTEREPVGYNSEFLLSYIPNQSYYLPKACRKELAELGKLGTNELPAGTYLRHILGRLLIDLSWNSSRLEGNTYSILETAKLLEQGVTADGKNTLEAQMILNHKAAIEMLADQTLEIGFNHYTICNLHALLADNLIGNEGAYGAVRSCAVGIGGSVYQPLNFEQSLEEHFRTIITKAAMINDPIEASFFVMVHMPYLQPFEDVNKRTSRLAANIPMVMQNLCPLSFTDVDREDYLNATLAVYELNGIEYLRDVFIWAYKRSCQRYSALRIQAGEPDPFKFKYRTQMKDTIRDIVQDGLGPQETEAAIETKAQELIPADEHKLFRMLVASEIKTLHLGNIMRYKLRPSEFTNWEKRQ